MGRVRFLDWLTPKAASENLWLVGKIEKRVPWTIVGLFTTREKALAFCTTPHHFLGPITVDAPMDPQSWSGVTFPMAETVDAVTTALADKVKEAIGGVR